MADRLLSEDRVVGHDDELLAGDGRGLVLADFARARPGQELLAVHGETRPEDEGPAGEQRITLQRGERGDGRTRITRDFDDRGHRHGGRGSDEASAEEGRRNPGDGPETRKGERGESGRQWKEDDRV